jgi:protein TonB
VRAFSPWLTSIIIHFFFALLFIQFYFFSSKETLTYEVPVIIEEPKMIQNLVKIEEKPSVSLKSVNQKMKNENKQVREVFGANRNALTDSEVASREAVEFKKGNTLTKQFDEKRLLDSDVDSLPTPVDEYLVSEMPAVLTEVRPDYPPEAKEQRLEGVVVLDILIDERGDVRTAEIVEGVRAFYKVALEAIKKFKFKPARLDGKSVAVKIRYNLRFQLEY